jgi:hypothetical protein
LELVARAMAAWRLKKKGMFRSSREYSTCCECSLDGVSPFPFSLHISLETYIGLLKMGFYAMWMASLLHCIMASWHRFVLLVRYNTGSTGVLVPVLCIRSFFAPVIAVISGSCPQIFSFWCPFFYVAFCKSTR